MSCNICCLGVATSILIEASLAWHQHTGHWNEECLAWLHRERGLVGPGELTNLITAGVPAALARDLTTAIQDAADPTEADKAS